MPGSSKIPPTLPPPEQPKEPEPPKKKPAPGSVSSTGLPEPFPGMMTFEDKDISREEFKKQFWNQMVKDMGRVIQKHTEKMREALKKLRKSEEGQEED